MPREVFIAGQILTAAEMNSVSDQTVMVFAGTAARGSAIPTPSEGMVTYLSDSNQVQAYTGSAFTPVSGILQVVSTAKTDTFSSTSTTFADVTGLTVTITPSSTSSKVLVMTTVPFGHSSATDFTGLTVADGSNNNLLLASSPGNRQPSFRYSLVNDVNGLDNASFQFLHSPNTTSAFTYKVRAQTNSGTLYVNRSAGDADIGSRGRGVATITVMEVAG